MHLVDVRDKEENLNLAIRAFEEALKIRTIEEYPIPYAETQNNLGEAYRYLADVKDKEENLNIANYAFEEALKIYTVGEYSLLRNNIILNIEKIKQIMK